MVVVCGSKHFSTITVLVVSDSVVGGLRECGVMVVVVSREQIITERLC